MFFGEGFNGTVFFLVGLVFVLDVVIEGEVAYRLPAVPVQFDGQPPPLRRAPEHGEDTEALLLEVGYEWEQIAELKEAGVIL